MDILWLRTSSVKRISLHSFNALNLISNFSLSTGDNNQNKNIEVSIERTIENGEDLTNVVIKGEGDVTRK